MDKSKTNLLILPGGSRYSYQWADDLRKQIDKEFKYVEIARYEHWREGNDQNVNLFSEASKASYFQNKFDSDFGVIAYSEGVAIALKAIRSGVLKPKFAVFISFPYIWAEGLNYDDELRSWLSGYQLPTLYIQGTNDPNFRFDRLRELVSSYSRNFMFHQVFNSSDSSYDDIYKLKELIGDFADKLD